MVDFSGGGQLYAVRDQKVSLIGVWGVGKHQT